MNNDVDEAVSIPYFREFVKNSAKRIKLTSINRVFHSRTHWLIFTA